jgi:hypothetical protein
VIGELEFIHIDFGLAEVLEVGLLFWEEEEEGFAITFYASAGPSHSVDVLSCLIGRVELDDPIYFRNVKSSCSHVCA